MFKPGDKVVYVVNGHFNYLTLNNTYIIVSVYKKDGSEYVSVIDNNGVIKQGIFSERFIIHISTDRKNKLEKIKKTNEC